MNNHLGSLIQINKDRAEPAVETLLKAFEDYPLLQYYFPDNSTREKISSYFLALAVYSGIRYGEVYATSENLEGIAIWIHSKNYPLTLWKILRSVPISKIFGFGRHGGSKLKHFNEYIDAIHQRQTQFNHWFLQAIGIAPKFQGKGYASKLIKPMLSKIDNEHLPCYLETISEKNVSIYEHFGFETIDKSTVPETPLINWAMLRKTQ